MSKQQSFTKPVLNIDEQIGLLQSRGLTIGDVDKARHYLSYIGYYRFSGYMKFFESTDEKFREGVDFSNVLDLYIFDRKLRVLVFDEIERIEVAIRSAMTLVMSENYGAHWFTQSNLFVDRKGKIPINGYRESLKFITKAVSGSKDKFIQHYQDKYSNPKYPPSWMTLETLSLGAISRIFSLLKVEHRKAIAELLKLKEHILLSWLHALTYTRNICAHHARLWNRDLIISVKPDKTKAACREDLFKSKRFYPQAVIMDILLSVIVPGSSWEAKLNALFNDHPSVDIVEMGFNAKWQGFNKGQ